MSIWLINGIGDLQLAFFFFYTTYMIVKQIRCDINHTWIWMKLILFLVYVLLCLEDG